MADKHLEAAARVLHGEMFSGCVSWHDTTDTATSGSQEDRRRALDFATKGVTAYLDSLLGELPEEAVEALSDAYLNTTDRFDAQNEFREAARAFLHSLRDSLASGRGE